MKENLIIAMIAVFNFSFAQKPIKQDINNMCKIILKKEFDKIIGENDDTYLSFITKDKSSKQMYEITSFSDKKDLIKRMYSGNGHIELYKNEESFFYQNKNLIKKLDHPLFRFRHLMKDIESNKDSLVETFFNDLKIDYPETIEEKDFNLINSKLKEIGFKKAYHKYYLHLLLICGDHLNRIDSYKSKWILEHSSSFPLSFEPTLKAPNESSYFFSLNTVLSRELMARFLGEDYAHDNEVNLEKVFSLQDIVGFSLDYRDILHKKN